MMILEDDDSFTDQLKNLASEYKLFFDSLRRLKGNNVNNALIDKSEEYLRNESNRLERLKVVYDEFSGQMKQICEKYLNEVNSFEEEELCDIDDLEKYFDKMKSELNVKNQELKKKSLYHEREPSFSFNNGIKSQINLKLVMKYPGSYLYREYMNGERTNDGDIFIDCDGKHDELIVKYMNDDKSLEEDLKKMNNEQRAEFIQDLDFLELPIKKDVIKQIRYDEDNEIMNAWRNRKVVLINGKNDNDFNMLLKKYNCFNIHFDNQYVKNIQYNNRMNLFYINMNMKYYDVIKDFLKNGKKMKKELVNRWRENGNSDELIEEMKMIGLKLNNESIEDIKACFSQPLFINKSCIIDNEEYEKYLIKWVGNYNWKLLHTASIYNYSLASFHSHCDNQGPTLIIIKSSEGWIFGGYTTQSWKQFSILRYINT